MNRKWFMVIIIVVISLFIFVVWKNTRSVISDFSFQQDTQVKQYEIKKIEASSPVYTHKDPNFSFQYPQDFKTTSFQDENGDTVLVQKTEDSIGLQVYIRKFSDTGDALTVQKIQTDLPTLGMENIKPLLFEGKESGFMFTSTRGTEDKTREVWFVHGGWLYQITAPLSFDDALEQVMNTWHF